MIINLLKTGLSSNVTSHLMKKLERNCKLFATRQQSAFVNAYCLVSVLNKASDSLERQTRLRQLTQTSFFIVSPPLDYSA